MQPRSPEPFEADPPQAGFALRQAARLLAEPEKLEAQVLDRIVQEPRRYGDLKPLLAGRRDHNLTVALANLQEEGLIERVTDVSRKPVVHTYRATPYGTSVVDTMARMTKAASWPAPARDVALLTVGSGKTKRFIELVTKQLDKRAIQHTTADLGEIRTKGKLASLIDDASFVIFVVGSSDDKSDKHFARLVDHLKDHPADSRRHCFFVHRDVDLTDHLGDALKNRGSSPLLQLSVWTDEKEAAKSAIEITERFVATGDASA